LIKVVLHRLLILRDIPEDTDAVLTKREVARLGLELPKSYDEELKNKALRENASMDKGFVIDIGPSAFSDYGIDPPVKIGDYITYAKFGGKDVVDPDDGKTYTVINDEDLVAIITKKEPIDG